MSANASFEGLDEALAGRDAAEDYTPGSSGFLFSHVERLIEEFLDGSISDIGKDLYAAVSNSPQGIAARLLPCHQREGFYRERTQQPVVALRADFISRLLPEGEFDANALLDMVIGGLGQRDYHDSFAYFVGEPHLDLSDLLDPLVQALYDRGHNDFVLDLTPLIDEKHSVNSIAFGLRGSEERPLSLVCKGETAFFGGYVSDCNLVLEGDMSHDNSHGGAGMGALRSTISAEGRLAPRTALGAEQCTFTLASMGHRCRIYSGLEDAISRVERIFEQAGTPSDPCEAYGCKTFYSCVASARDCAFHVLTQPESEDLASLKAAGFFVAGLWSRKRNRLFVPDTGRPGEWKEVRH